jgi:hypothetical protein
MLCRISYALAILLFTFLRYSEMLGMLGGKELTPYNMLTKITTKAVYFPVGIIAID